MILQTERLQLRPFNLSDAPDFQRLAGDKDVASTTLSIEHPYEDGLAEQWIRSSQIKSAAGDLITFAITLLTDCSFLGSISLHPNDSRKQSEISYWIGKPYWNQGYATEAVAGVLSYAFNNLKFERVYAAHFTRNIASGRVMQKAGMLYEGSQLGPTIKWGVLENLELYGISRHQFGVIVPPNSV
ncbi:MAG: GNAT family N-acetyltransferase [Chloroflexota bacterium]|nr:GNAT family N-acetyltransferase [Chloroflexota bacterium]